MPADIQLNADQRKKLIAAADRVQWARRQLDRLKSAGIDVSEHEAAIDQAEQLRQGMLNSLGPTPGS